MLKRFLNKQMPWSIKTFGEGYHYTGILDHIRSELIEIEQKPDDLEEWIDVVQLALDGAARCNGGHTADEIIEALIAKQKKNFGRKWHKPDANGFTRHVKEEHE